MIALALAEDRPVGQITHSPASSSSAKLTSIEGSGRLVTVESTALAVCIATLVVGGGELEGADVELDDVVWDLTMETASARERPSGQMTGSPA